MTYPVTLLWILLFGAVVPLSDQPLNLAAGTHDIPLPTPISAITSGAALNIDLTHMLPPDALTVHGSGRWIEQHVAPGCITAVLRDQAGTATKLGFRGASSFASGQVMLVIRAEEGAMPVRQDFTQLRLTTCIPLSQVRLYWRNFET